jgi:hypothetical protein
MLWLLGTALWGATRQSGFLAKDNTLGCRQERGHDFVDNQQGIYYNI